MKVITFDEICESQEFEHKQQFVKLEEVLDVIGIAKSQFDIVKNQRRDLEIAVSQLKVAIKEVRKLENKCAHMQTSYNGQALWCYTCGHISLIEEVAEQLQFGPCRDCGKIDWDVRHNCRVCNSCRKTHGI